MTTKGPMVHNTRIESLILRIRLMLTCGASQADIAVQLHEEDQGLVFLCYQAALMVQEDDERGGLT